MDCIFATYAALPDLDPHDRLVVEELQKRGLAVSAGVWSDPDIDWAAARLCVIRSTWDYPNHIRPFLTWLDTVNEKTIVRNDIKTVRWNVHKFYLRDIERAGVRIVPTAWLTRAMKVRLDQLMAENGWEQVIVKPSFGGSSLNILHVTSREGARCAGQLHLDGLLQYQDVLVQPYLSTMQAHPERALIFIAGEYSHAVTKVPFQTALPNGEAGDAPLVCVTQDEIALAERAIAQAPASPLYARVDIVRDECGAPCIMELELIEPTLFLGVHPPSVRMLADAIVLELEAISQLTA